MGGVKYRQSNKPGRNDRCECGSGRKHKHCCGRPAAATALRWTPKDGLPDKHTDVAEERWQAYLASLDRSRGARALVATLAEVIEGPVQSGPSRADRIAQQARGRRQSRERSRRHKGHPRRLSREDKQAAHADPDSWLDPKHAEIEKGTQQLNRLMRKTRNEEQYEGAVGGSLGVSAIYAAEQTVRDWIARGIVAEKDYTEHHAALVEWYVGNWGQFIHDTAGQPSGYFAWRNRVVPRRGRIEPLTKEH